MKCKYCDSAVMSDEDGVPEWSCGSHHPYGGDVIRTVECIARAEEKYRAMFPVAPWSTDPVTAGVCESLGMVADGRWWIDTNSGVSVFIAGDDKPFVRGDGYGKTAGQLACLVAARKTTNDDQPGE